MGSSAEPERSLSSSISIPQWMKNRIGDRYDIEEPFSPPTHDDTFFYVRYPKSKVKPTKEPGIKLIEEENTHTPLQDYSQHTPACRQFIPESKMNVDIKELSSKSQPSHLKPQATDNGFSGDSAACGKSVVQVAQQMIAGKMLMRGFSIASNDNLSVPMEGFDPTRRRGSRSLPASPLGTPSQSPESSPRARRKPMFPNRYFTGTFGGIDNKSTVQETSSKYPGSWILSSFLGQRENVATRTSVIHEEDHQAEKDTEQKIETSEKQTATLQQEEKVSDIRRNKSTPILTATISLDEYSETDSPPISTGAMKMFDQQPKKIFQPKPSELREMNFWSPTSM